MKMLDNNIAIKNNNKKPSVCFLAPYALPVLKNASQGSGGAERQFVLFGRFLSKQGWNVSYIVDAKKKVESSEISSWYQIYEANFSYLGGSNWNIVSGILSLYNAMRYSTADVFVLKTQAFLLLPMSFFSILLGKKVVFWAQLDRDCRRKRDDVLKILSWAQNQGMKAVKLFITQSQSQASELKANFGYDAVVIPSIASTLKGAGSDDFTKKVDLNSTRLVLWCGNSGPHKRHEIALNLARMMPDVSFIMAMGIADVTRYKKAEEAAGSIPNLKFLGSVPPRQMEDWFFKSALYINTSTFEGFPNTYIQSWQAGIPVVSLNIDPDDILSKNQMGVVLDKQISGIDPWDFYSLAASLVPVVSRLLDNTELRISMGERAQKYVRQFHQESVVGHTLESSLLSILS